MICETKEKVLIWRFSEFFVKKHHYLSKLQLCRKEVKKYDKDCHIKRIKTFFKMRCYKFFILLAFYLFYIMVLGGLVFSALERPADCAKNVDPSEGQLKVCEDWNWYNSSFVAFTAVTTIGYGNMAPATQGGRGYCIIYSLFGVPLNDAVILTIAAYLTDFVNWAFGRIPDHFGGVESKKAKFASACLGSVLALGFILFFMILPSIAFYYDEEDWTFLDAFYFSFITLTTIGFGDIVAGKGQGARRHLQGWRAVAEFAMMWWIIFGLAFIIMVFNIITEHATKGVNKLTKKQKAKMEDVIADMLEDLEVDNESDREKFAHGLADKLAEIAEHPEDPKQPEEQDSTKKRRSCLSA